MSPFIYEIWYQASRIRRAKSPGCLRLSFDFAGERRTCGRRFDGDRRIQTKPENRFSIYHGECRSEREGVLKSREGGVSLKFANQRNAGKMPTLL